MAIARLKARRLPPPRAPRLLVAAILACSLGGCANFDAFRKCGYHGCAGDAAVTDEVRALLQQHPALGPPNQIYVNTEDRVVFLSGQVATELQRAIADEVALGAPGARRVVNNIALSYDGR